MTNPAILLILLKQFTTRATWDFKLNLRHWSSLCRWRWHTSELLRRFPRYISKLDNVVTDIKSDPKLIKTIQVCHNLMPLHSKNFCCVFFFCLLIIAADRHMDKDIRGTPVCPLYFVKAKYIDNRHHLIQKANCQ